MRKLHGGNLDGTYDRKMKFHGVQIQVRKCDLGQNKKVEEKIARTIVEETLF